MRYVLPNGIIHQELLQSSNSLGRGYWKKPKSEAVVQQRQPPHNQHAPERLSKQQRSLQNKARKSKTYNAPAHVHVPMYKTMYKTPQLARRYLAGETPPSTKVSLRYPEGHRRHRPEVEQDAAPEVEQDAAPQQHQWQRDRLLASMRPITPDHNVRVHTCSFCDARFNKPRAWASHIRMHRTSTEVTTVYTGSVRCHYSLHSGLFVVTIVFTLVFCRSMIVMQCILTCAPKEFTDAYSVTPDSIRLVTGKVISGRTAQQPR